MQGSDSVVWEEWALPRTLQHGRMPLTSSPLLQGAVHADTVSGSGQWQRQEIMAPDGALRGNLEERTIKGLVYLVDPVTQDIYKCAPPCCAPVLQRALPLARRTGSSCPDHSSPCMLSANGRDSNGELKLVGNMRDEEVAEVAAAGAQRDLFAALDGYLKVGACVAIVLGMGGDGYGTTAMARGLRL